MTPERDPFRDLCYLVGAAGKILLSRPELSLEQRSSLKILIESLLEELDLPDYED